MDPTIINPPDQSPPDIAQLKPEASSDIIWHSPVGIFTSTPKGRYTFANPATARISGYPSPAELIASVSNIGSQIYADPTERETFQRQLREEGELVNHEYHHRRLVLRSRRVPDSQPHRLRHLRAGRVHHLLGRNSLPRGTGRL